MNNYPYNQQVPSQKPYQGSARGGVSGRTYAVDLVFCIDATGSMEGILDGREKVIDMVKNNALSFYSDLMSKMAAKHKTIHQLRVRVIAFRDYIADGDQAMLVTDFFPLPQATEAFASCINSISAMGGGDEPEDGLEALAYAIRSKWTSEGTDRRQVIVVWTDASTHPLQFGSKAKNYPKGMPKDLSELSDWWDDYMEFNAKRLILFAPNAESWSYIVNYWDNVIHYPSVAGNGLAEKDYEAIIDAIANSICV